MLRLPLMAQVVSRIEKKDKVPIGNKISSLELPAEDRPYVQKIARRSKSPHSKM